MHYKRKSFLKKLKNTIITIFSKIYFTVSQRREESQKKQSYRRDLDDKS